MNMLIAHQMTAKIIHTYEDGSRFYFNRIQREKWQFTRSEEPADFEWWNRERKIV